MNVVDSSLWMEYFLGNPIDFTIKNAIESKKSLIIPTICIYEIYRKMQTEKDKSFADVLVDIMKDGLVVDINTEIAVFAAELGKLHKLPMADSIIYATAQTYNAILWTQDQHFEDLNSVKYFKKNK